ncbi:universal stress protein [Streptomyces sp. NPDC127114]|uniref:universal stress protein n=1 Tax=Streptomyces sp. NPDC127114 TaxID=3345366 RepID=UPI00363AD5DF
MVTGPVVTDPVAASPVVVGVDGSDAGLAALDWAVDEAMRHGRPLRIVYASLWERYEGVASAPSTDRPSEQVLAEDIVGTAVERARRRAPGLALTADVLAEDASRALLREGQEALLLVVGSRGRGEPADLLLGSVGLMVAARAPGPAVVVRGDRHALEARHQRVLLGVGDHDVDSPAVRFAFREAAVRNAELDVVSTWRRPAHAPAGHPLLAGEPGAYLEHRASALLDKALDPLAREYPRVRLRRSTVEGPAHRVLTERSAAADLLVVGARRRGRLVGLELGRVAHRALHHASCPVAVVPQHLPALTEGDQ